MSNAPKTRQSRAKKLEAVPDSDEELVDAPPVVAQSGMPQDPPMTEWQALQIVAQLAGMAPVNLETHMQGQAALRKLNGHLLETIGAPA